MFQLDAQLAADSRLIASLASSDWLLMNDSRFVWLAQVPRFAGARLLVDLPKNLRNEVRAESDLVVEILRSLFNLTKSTSLRSAMWCLNCTSIMSPALLTMRCGPSQFGGRRLQCRIGKLNIAIVWHCFGRTFSTPPPRTLRFLF